MKAEVEILHAKIPMKLHSPHLLRNALLAALLCCTTAFGTVTVTVDGQPSSLEQLSGTPSGSVSITVEGEDATLSHPVTLDNEANHFITVEEGHSLTIMGGLTFSNPWPDGWEHWDGEANILSVRGEIIFAAGESVLVGCMDGSGAGPIIAQAGPITVQEGAKLTLNNAGFLCVSLTVEGGGELVAGDDVNCSALNGKGTLRFSEDTNGREGNMTILGNNAGPANFEGKIDGHGFICVEGYIGDSGETPLNSSRPGVLPTRQIFTNVTAEGVSLDTTIGDVSFAGSENKFRSLAVGDIYNGIITDIDSRNPYPNSLRDTLTIEEGTKVFFGKLFDDPDWHYNEEVGYEKFDPQIYSPVRQRGLSFDMEDRSELLVRFGKGETGAKITASGAIVLKTTTWEEDVSNPIKPAVRVEFAENPGKDLKQLLIQSNGIVLTSIEYGEHTAPDNEGQLHDHLTTFLVTEQYTDESSEDDLNKWLKENVTVTVNGYDDPYLMVEKKGESLIELYVAAGDVADLPDPSEPGVTVTVDGKLSSLEHLSGTPKGSVSITVKGEDATLSHPVTLDGSVDHYITVEEGHSLTIMGGLMYDGELSSDRLFRKTLHLFERSSLGDQDKQGGTIIFAAGESELGRVSGGSGEVIVKKGASLTISDDRSGLDGALTIEEGGNVTVRDMICEALNGGGTLTLLKDPVYGFSLFGIFGSGGNFSGTIEGEEFVELENHLDLAQNRPQQNRPQQTFTGVTAQGTKLSVIHGDAVFVGAKNEFKGLQLGSDYNFGYYDTSDNPNKLKIMSTLTIKEGTKVSLGKLLDDPDWHNNEESGVMTFDPQIYKPVKQRGFSFDMEDRSEMVVRYGKGETGAKITASGAIVLKTTTWDEDISNPTKLAVRVEFAENPGKDLKQLLIQANGIVLSAMKYSRSEQFEFTLLEQYTDENSEADLNKWLKENVTVTVNGYDDPYLMVEKKGESLIELYVAAGDVADLPDPSEPGVTVTVDGQPSSLEKLTGTPKGSVSVTVKGEDATLSHPVTLDGSVDHYITVEEGHSLTVMGGLMYDGELSSDRLSKNTLHLFESSSLSDQGMQGGTIIFAAGESELGRVSGGSGEVIVKKGASLTISDDRSYLNGALTIEEGGNMTVSDMGCMTLNGGGTLTLLKHPVDGFSIFTIYGGSETGNFSGMIEGEQFVEIDNGPATVDPKKIKQIFTDVTAKGTKLSVFIGELVLAGGKSEFNSLQQGYDYNIAYYDTTDNPNKLQNRSTLTIEEGTKVSLGKLLDDPDWHYNEESGVTKFDPQIYKPVKQKGLSFEMEDRSEMVVKYGKGEMGAKITASGAIVLKTTTWEEDLSNPTKLAVRVDFAENPGKDLKQLLIQANGIVLTSMEYGWHDALDGDQPVRVTSFLVTEQYTDENSEEELNKWLKENVTVTVNGYEDPYLIVEKKGESLIELYVAAGDVADLPDPSEPGVTVTVDGKPSSLEQLSGTPRGSVSITVKEKDAILDHDLTLDGSADHYITVEKGHSLTIRGSLTYDGRQYGDVLRLSFFPDAKIIFASGESKLGGVIGYPSDAGTVVVQKGAKLTLRDIVQNAASLTIEEGGELIAGDNVGCSSLNGKGALRFAGRVEDWYDGEISIEGSGGVFEGNVEGIGWMDVTGLGMWESAEQTFSNVTARETILETILGNAILAGSKNEFQEIVLGGYVPSTSVPDITDTLSIEKGTKVTLGKSSVQPDDDPDPTDPWDPHDVWDPKIDAPFITGGRELSFRMKNRSQLVMKYGKGETGAKITASGAINLTTTTWEDTTTKLAVRVEFAENPGKDLKQLLIQANGIVLTSMGYTTPFTLLEQYTDENSESELNNWLKENVTVEVDDYADPYLVVKKKEGRLVQLYVVAGDGVDLPDDPIDSGSDDPGTDTPGTDTPGTDTPGTDTPGTDTPGTDTPGTDTPGTDTPGTDTPGTDTPGTDTPGTDTPGASNPDTIFAPLATSENTQAGAGMLYHAMNLSTSSELQNVVGVIAELAQIGQGGQPAVAMAAMIAEPGTAEMLIKETAIDPVVAKSEAQRLMSAVVGSAVPALGAAQRDAMRGQLARAASRAARLGQGSAARGDSSQSTHVWMEGMGGRAKLDRSGDETGYEHNAWGAGVGVEKELRGGATTVGLSLVASYGDLKVDAADHAEGDLDTYYVNLYTHHRSGSFHHSFVLSAGFSDAEFNRTICGGVAPYVLDYATNGSTNGTGFGAAYELAYDIPLNEQKSSLLQPLIGLSFVTTKMDGYNEGGAGDVGLHVGEQESTLTTLTAGARFVSQCGEQAFSRAAVLALRANVAVDMGDRRSEADVSFLGDRSYSGRIRSAETGVVGAQLGASVNVPVDSNTVLYVNGEADLRSGSNSWNVGAGVSVTF